MDSLKDPCKDRQVPDHPPPPAQPLDEKLLYPSGDRCQPNLEILKTHLFGEGRLKKETMMDLITRATQIFASEPSLLKLKDPITVVGDIHGQYYDILKLFEVAGDPSNTQFIFLGDYVDRGSYSIEVLALQYATKIMYPKTFWMLRGNHESRAMTAFFNFRDECEYKFNTEVYDAIMESFDALPLCAVINGKFFAVHGGLSPDLTSLKAVKNLDRVTEPPREGILCDLIWSDPHDDKEGEPPSQEKFITNEVRGCSYFFTFVATSAFLSKNQLLSVVRAHEAQNEGYKMHKVNPGTGFPSVITIFSAPNYCDVYNNKAAILKFDNNTLNILQFNCSPHPYHLPNFMDLFTWSMPFIVEKVTEMLYYILQPNDMEEEMEDTDFDELPPVVDVIMRKSLTPEQNEAVHLAAKLQQQIDAGGAAPLVAGNKGDGERISKEKGDRMRKKIRTVAKMARMFKTLRQENETVIRLKGMCPGHKLEPGLLLAGKEAIHSQLERFERSRDIDLANEKAVFAS